MPGVRLQLEPVILSRFLLSWPTTSRLFERVHVQYLKFQGHNVLVSVIGYFLRIEFYNTCSVPIMQHLLFLLNLLVFILKAMSRS